jgi:hypothetical protein
MTTPATAETFNGHAQGRTLARRLALVLTLNCLLSYPLLYTAYKGHDLADRPLDHAAYFAMAERPFRARVDNPFRYRVLTPLMVRLCRPLPSYDIEIASRLNRDQQRTFFHFAALGFVLLQATALVLYAVGTRVFGLTPPGAYLAGLVFLLSFYNAVTTMVASADAGAHLLIALGTLALFRRRYWWLAIVATLGVLQKETVVLVLGLLTATEIRADRPHTVRALACLVPAVVLYAAFRLAAPAPGNEHFFQPLSLLRSLASLADPRMYSRTFVFHVFLANAPLLAALAAHAVLQRHGHRISFPLRYLLLPALLMVVAMALDLGNNVGRIVAFAAPVSCCYVAAVVEALARAAGWGRIAGDQTAVGAAPAVHAV